MRSASALYHHCSYPVVLSREVPKKSRQLAAATKGNAFHQAIAAWGMRGELPGDGAIRTWVEGVASWWTPPTGAMFEFPLGLGRSGRYVPVREVEPHVYVATAPAEPLLTAGRADVVWLRVEGDRRIATVLDWKTGKFPSPSPAENLQLTALALAAASMLQADEFERMLVYVQDMRVDADISPVLLDSDAGADAWAMVERAAKMDESPRPGSHCAECWEARLKRCSFAAKAAA